MNVRELREIISVFKEKLPVKPRYSISTKNKEENKIDFFKFK